MIVKEIADLHKDLREKTGKNIPYSVTWELTYMCANNCNYCYQKKIRNNISEDVPLEKIISTLTSLYDMGCRNIIFSGGDPLLHNCFEEILSVSSKIGFKISIYTSGVQIRESVFDAISQSNIDSIEITILGSDAQTHDLLAGRKDSFDNIISNVTRLVGCGINVILKTTLEEKNIDFYDEMCLLAQKLTGKELLVNTRFLQQYGIPSNEQLNRGLPFEKLVNFYLQHRELVTQYKRDQIVMCEAGISTLGIRPNGDVLPCSMFMSEHPFGNISTDDIRSIWVNRNAKSFRERYKYSNRFPHKECISCKNSLYCDICPGISSWNKGDNGDFGHICMVADSKRVCYEAEESINKRS